MNKSTIEAGQPEQATVNEQKADIIPSARLVQNGVLAEAPSVQAGGQ